MSRPEVPHRPFFPGGNPFKMMLPRGSSGSSRLLGVFEENLAERFRRLKPNHAEDVISFSWMKSALITISETLYDMNRLVVALELPICSWDTKWADIYLDNSLKLLDFGSAYGTDITRLRVNYIMLKCALVKLDSTNPQKLMQASSSLDEWRQYLSSSDYSKLDECCDIIHKLEETLNLPKIKNVPKAKDLLRAMYGFKVQTMFIFRMLVVAFSSLPQNLVNIQVMQAPKKYLWQEAFTDLQAFMNGEVKKVYANGGFSPLKELRAIDLNVKKLYPLVHDGLGDVKEEAFKSYRLELMESNEKFLTGLDELKLELDRFFNVVISGRMALLDNFRQPLPRSGMQHVRM